MQRLFDPRRGGLPYFFNTMSGPTPSNGHHVSFSISHIPGRWLNALLNAEAVAGVEIGEGVIENLRGWAIRSLDNPMHLPSCVDLQTFEPVLVSDLHNLRESAHAMHALIVYRADDRAAQLIDQQIRTVDKYLDFDSGQWNEQAFTRETGGRTSFSPLDELRPIGFTDEAYVEGTTFPRTFGRYIGPLVKLYRDVGIDSALSQAIRLTRLAMDTVLLETGEYDPIIHGAHTHSTTSMLSGVALLGELLGDRLILDRVDVFMKNGLTKIAQDFGWCTENFNRGDHYGEINNTVDLIETSFVLARAGYPGHYQRAERMIRAHLLPAQLLDTPFIPDWDEPEADFHHLMAQRSYGAFGFPCPYGHEYEDDGWISFNWDIVGGGVSGLCEVVRNRVTTNGGMTSINLLFDHDDDRVAFTSPYGESPVAVIAAKRDGTYRLRVSDWTPLNEITVNHSSDQISSTVSGQWLYLFGMKAGDQVEVAFPLVESTSYYSIKGDPFSIDWQGDAVVATSEGSRRLRFFPARGEQ